MAAEETPDLVLLDYMMPVKNGFDAFQEIRRNPALCHVPVIVLTAFGQNIGEIHGLAREGRSAGIRDCLEKPVEPNVLLERVAAVLEKSVGDSGNGSANS